MSRQGRFDSTESMRAFQETTIEVAKSSAVVSAALKQLGPPKSLLSNKKFPTDDDIQKLQESISVAAPKGSELGSTEVLYLSVKGKTPEDAIARTNAVFDQLERHLVRLSVHYGDRDFPSAKKASDFNRTLSSYEDNIVAYAVPVEPCRCSANHRQ